GGEPRPDLARGNPPRPDLAAPIPHRERLATGREAQREPLSGCSLIRPDRAGRRAIGRDLPGTDPALLAAGRHPTPIGRGSDLLYGFVKTHLYPRMLLPPDDPHRPPTPRHQPERLDRQVLDGSAQVAIGPIPSPLEIEVDHPPALGAQDHAVPLVR